MDVSIVIPIKNGGELLRRVISKIGEQQTNYKFEVICVDSGSKDNSVEIIKEFNFCKLFQILPQEFGHGKTRNFGASKGSGEYIVFITQDALPCDNHWLQNFIDAMKQDEEVVGAFGIHYPYPDCNVFDKRDIEIHFKGFGDKNTIFQLTDKERYEKEEGYRHLLAFYSDNNSCMKRVIWEKHPYADVNFAEDQIWARQMIELGYKKLYCPFAGVYHSHNFKLRAYFSRYYDEYKGIYQLHRYRIAENRVSMLARCLRHIQSEWKYVNTLDLNFTNKMKWRNYSFWRNIFRYQAGYIAGKYHLQTKEKQEKLDARYSQQTKQIKA